MVIYDFVGNIITLGIVYRNASAEAFAISTFFGLYKGPRAVGERVERKLPPLAVLFVYE